MAVFLVAGDETEPGDQTGPFMFGGYVAPVLDWTDHFAPAWQERVLNGNPVLPYFHMTEMNSEDGRHRLGIGWRDAQNRITEAVNVIRSMGSLHAIRNTMDGAHVRSSFKKHSLIKSGKQPGVFAIEPDYFGYMGFAVAALNYVYTFHPEAEKVDFLIERKEKVTNRIITEFHQGLGDNLEEIGSGHLKRLIGEAIPGGKDRVPLQAADMFLWHLLRFESGTATRDDLKRLHEMHHGRLMTETGMPLAEVTGMSERAKENTVPSPFKPKAKPARISGGGSSEGVA